MQSPLAQVVSGTFAPCGCNTIYRQIEPDDARMHQPFILQDDLQMNSATIVSPTTPNKTFRSHNLHRHMPLQARFPAPRGRRGGGGGSKAWGLVPLGRSDSVQTVAVDEAVPYMIVAVNSPPFAAKAAAAKASLGGGGG